MGIALRPFKKLLAANRQTTIPRKGVGHIRLPAAKPHIAEKDVADCDFIRAAGCANLSSILVGGLCGQANEPASVCTSLSLANTSAVEFDDHIVSRFGKSPHGHGEIALQNHVFRYYIGEFELAGVQHRCTTTAKHNQTLFHTVEIID